MKKLLTILFLFVSSICFAQHQWNTYVTASGTDTYAVTVSVPTITNYTTKRINLRFANANTGASTLNVTPSGASALGAIAIRAWDGDSWEALAGGEIVTGQDYVLVYNGTYFELYPSVVSGEFVYSMQTISGTTHTINAAAIGELNKWFIYTNASGCTVTVGDDVGVGKSVVGQRGPAAGTVTFVDNGTSVLISSSGDFDLEAVNRKASLTKQTSTDWDVTGELGPASGTTLTDGEGTTANGSAVDLGGVISANLLFTGSGNWTWGSNGTPYSGFLNFKGLYTAGAGGINFEVRDASNRYSVFNQSGEDFTMAVRDPTSGFERTSLTMHGSTASIDLIANTALLLGTFSDAYHLSFTEGSGVSLKLGSDATGDIYYRNSSGFLTRLGVGSNTNVLTLAGGVPTWAAPAGGGDALTSNPLSQFAATTSAQLRGVISDEVGTGALVFESGAPTLTGTNFTGIPYGALTGTSPFWGLTGSSSFTGAVDINGSSTNVLRFNFDNLGTTQTDGAGLGLVNGTAAAAGAQQISPSINFRGHGWKTNATAASQPVEFKIYNLPVQGAAAPTGNLTIAQSINDAANTTLLTIGSDGLFTLTSATSGNGATFRTGANLYIRHNEVGSIFFGNTSNARIGSAAAGTFGVTSGSLAYGADTDHYFSTATVSNITLASSNKYQFSGSFSGTSGTNTGKFYRLVPTYNITGGTIPVYDFIIESVETSFSGPHYGIVNTSTTALNGLGTSTPTERLDVNGNGKFAGNVTLSTAGNKLFIKEGTNASMGNSVLVGGTVTVNTTAVTASSEIFLTHKVAGGTLGVVSIGTVTAGTSFVINSSSGTDTSTISWVIIEPAP